MAEVRRQVEELRSELGEAALEKWDKASPLQNTFILGMCPYLQAQLHLAPNAVPPPDA